MLSISKNFLFIHIPKTGGNSVQSILIDYSEDELTTKIKRKKQRLSQGAGQRFGVYNALYDIDKKHFPLLGYKSKLEENLYSQLFKFTIVRNPWDRMISFYFSPHMQRECWVKGDFIKMLDKVKPVNYFIRSEEVGGIYDEMDMVLRFENLHQDFSELCDALSLPRISLPHINRSSREHYSAYYDDETREMVFEKFQEEINAGKYVYG